MWKGLAINLRNLNREYIGGVAAYIFSDLKAKDAQASALHTTTSEPCEAIRRKWSDTQQPPHVNHAHYVKLRPIE